jgi:predicted phage replisome organizer
MADIKWIKIIVNIFDDEKIRLIETLPDADTILIIWFKLLTLAGKCNDNGIVYLTRDIPYNAEMLSTIIRRPINTVRLALGEFEKLGMISIENNFIALLNWDKHQSVDKLEKIHNQTRLRVSKHREKQKHLCNATVTLRNATEQEQEQEEEKNKINTGRTNLDHFELFWSKYNKKIKRNTCLKLWSKIDPSLYIKIFEHVKIYVEATPDKQFRKHPETYLKNECWNDEIITIKNKEKSIYPEL